MMHLPLETGLFLWHVGSISLMLLACWQLSGCFFPNARARWGAVSLVAALFTIPVAGTALYIFDQYPNPRNLAAFAGVFAVASTVRRKYPLALLWLAFAGSVHPLMAAFAFSFCALLVVVDNLGPKANIPLRNISAGLACLLPFGITLDPPTSPAYHAAAMRHEFHYIQLWHWYGWLGILAPIAVLWWFGRLARARQWPRLDLVCRCLVIYDLVYFFSALAVDFPARFESLARLQPLRSLHLLYIIMFLIMGGLVGELLLANRAWRWLVLFVPLGLGMFLAQRSLFPASAHIEWPGVETRNPWGQAFAWIRGNTPTDALFAIDTDYMQISGEDTIGFRCLAQRSRLADATKDSGAVSMFPPLAEEWWSQVQAQSPWKNFGLDDFVRLKATYGVSWVVVHPPGARGLDCAYQNSAVSVCRIP